MSSQAPAPLPLIGTTLAGKYRVERVLGQGGMGVVVEARHLTLDERVALKFLLPEYATNAEMSARFVREAQVAAKIKSEHVARVTDVGTLETGAGYMVMEYLDGRDLSGLLEKQGVLPIAEAVDYVIQACEALVEAHGYGIVHRDLKPANLFLTKRPNGLPLVKVLDFGISKVNSNTVDNLTRTTAAMGSALYMSPEQMQQARGVDHRTDIYALGVSLYELLAGKQPFVADTLPALCAEIFTGTPTPIRSIREDIPEGLAAVLEKAYARDRGARYQSVGELVVALAPWAPPQSQTVLESIARIAGLPAPVAGAPVSSVSLSGEAPARPSVAGASSGAAAASPVSLSGGAPTPPGVAASSDRASAAPVLGGMPATTGAGVALGAEPAKPSSRAALVAVALCVVAIAAGGAYFGLHGAKPSASAPGPTSVAAGDQPGTQVPAATARAATAVAPAATASPSAQAAPATAAPSATASAEARASATTGNTPKPPAPETEKARPSGAPPKPKSQASQGKPAAKPGPPVDVAGF